MPTLKQITDLLNNEALMQLVQKLPLDKLPLDQLAGKAMGKIDELKRRERMSAVDTAWLRMDTPQNLMMIVGVMMFAGELDFARLKRTFEKRLLRYKRFKQSVQVDPSGAYWLDPEPGEFDLDHHVELAELPKRGGKPGGKEELEEYVAALTTTPLDPAKPLWHMNAIPHYRAEDGTIQWALVMRIHHCIADGIALIGVTYSLTDAKADADEDGIVPEALARAARRKAERAAADEDTGGNMWKVALDPLTQATVKAIDAYGNVAAKGIRAMGNLDKWPEYARVAASVAKEAVMLAALPNDSDTRFKGKPGTRKEVAWSEPIPLNEIKAVGKVLGASLNDVLLSCVAGALRSYLVKHGDATEGVEVRAFVPVNLRAPGEEYKLGNHFGLVALTLPVGTENPFQRLYETKRNMEELKSSYQAALSLGILGLVGYFPKAVQSQVLGLLSKKGTAVMTNVPGPASSLYLAGSELVQQMFWVPQSGDVGMGVSILSYNGGVQFGLVTDKKFVPDPAAIIAQFQPEFDKLLYWLMLYGPSLDEAEISLDEAVKNEAQSGSSASDSGKPAPEAALEPSALAKKSRGGKKGLLKRFNSISKSLRD